MLMPKKNRVCIYEHLFKEGVMVAEKDFHAAKHPELENIPNLQVGVFSPLFDHVQIVHVRPMISENQIPRCIRRTL